MKLSQNLDLVAALDLTFSGLDKKKQTCYQFVYASQLYGTLFAVYARFKGKKSSDGKFFIIKSVSLRLVNYQGIINIGFTNDDIVFEVEKGEMNLKFVVRGASRRFVKNYIFKTQVNIESGSRVPLVFNRILVPLTGFTPHHASGKPGARRGMTPPIDFFDAEFYCRNGIDYYYNILRPGMYGYKEDKKNLSADPSKLPSGRCHRSKVILYF